MPSRCTCGTARATCCCRSIATIHASAMSDRPLHAGEGAAGQAIKLRRTVVVDDYVHFEQAVPWGVERGLKSVEAVPLMLDDRPIGALVIRFYSQRPATGADEARTLDLLAALAAPALEAARLYASSRLEREHERALREITSALAENLDEHHVLELAVESERAACSERRTRASGWSSRPASSVCAAAEGYTSSDTFIRPLAHDSISGMAARQQILNLGNAPAETNWYFNREFGERTGSRRVPGCGPVAGRRVARRDRSHAPDRLSVQRGRGAVAGQPGKCRRRRGQQCAHPRRGRASRARSRAARRSWSPNPSVCCGRCTKRLAAGCWSWTSRAWWSPRTRPRRRSSESPPRV